MRDAQEEDMLASQWHQRAIFATTCAGFAGGLVSAPVYAQQKYPTKPVRLVVSTTAGSQPDMIARVLAQKLSETWGQPVVVDNRPGGGGTLAAIPVATAASDGYTLLYTLPNFMISAAMQPSLPYDPLKDFTAISQIGMSTNVLVASPALSVKSLNDLVTLAKAQPGKLIHASSAVGSASHLTGARINYITGIKVVNVAFKGGPDATIELLAGRASFHVGTMGVCLPFIKEGKLVALGVTTPQRAAVLPDVPSLGELLAEFKRPETTHGLVAPAGTPRAIRDELNKQLAVILELADVKERLGRISYVIAPTTPDEYEKILRSQIEGLSALVLAAGLKPKS
jgi:tripartite-type tricarboxylate transporter receptor subunit TctC